MQKNLLFALLSVFAFLTFSNGALTAPAASSYVVRSPDQKIAIHLEVQKQLMYQVFFEGQRLLGPAPIHIELQEAGVVTQNPQVVDVQESSVNRVLPNPAGTFSKEIVDQYQELHVQLVSGMGFKVRVYNDGWAFRPVLFSLKKDWLVKNEMWLPTTQLTQVFTGFQTCQASDAIDCYHSSYENLYETKTPAAITSEHRLQTPTLFSHSSGTKILFLEADSRTYPGTWLQKTEDGFLKTVSPLLPAELRELKDDWGFAREVVARRASAIAQIRPGYSYLPWQAMHLLQNDKQLLSSNWVDRLSNTGRQIERPFVPGFATNEWIIDAKPKVNPDEVGFIPGLNTATYKYYIDFAAESGLKYITLDAGWSKIDDLGQRNPDMNVPEIAAYARSKNVGIILWTLYTTLKQDLKGHLDEFKALGASGVKVDFMERDDQKMNVFIQKLAHEAGQRDLFVMLHGTSKPTGLHQRHPAIATYEAGRGHEFNKFGNSQTPQHRLNLAFMRMTSGPFDWVGAPMQTAHPEDFKQVPSSPMGQGTMASQIAPYVFFASPVQSIAGDLVEYRQNPALLRFLTQIPPVWDETRALEGQLHSHAVIARRKGNVWYVAGLNSDSRKSVHLDLSWLPHTPQKITAVVDSLHSDHMAMSYEIHNLSPSLQTTISMARNGGFVLKIEL